MTLQAILAGLSLIGGLISYFSYFRAIYKGQCKPHALSWLIWGLSGSIAFVAQVLDGGGAGALTTGFTGAVSVSIFFIALFKGSRKAAPLDWMSLGAALFAIPLWIMTDDALYSLLLIIFIECLGFVPSYRKSYHAPEEEDLLAWSLGTLKLLLGILALEHFSLYTLLYPAVFLVMNSLFVGMLVWRRRILQ
jgi:hypothetical protein